MTTWTLDAAHSSVEFAARHMMVSNVRGRFRDVAVTASFDPRDPGSGAVEAVIQAASIDTGVEPRDQHLRSADVLDVERFPVITFRSRAVERAGGDRFRVPGDLTIRGETRPVTLESEFLGVARNLQGGLSAGFTAKARISRKDWGLTWNVGLETGGWLVGDDVRIEIDVELVSSAAEREVAKVESGAA